MKTNTELTKYCENALKEKWYYGWGAWGQKATVALVDSLINDYDSNIVWRSYMLKAVTNNNRLCDCYGLVKGFLFTNSLGVMMYDPSLDVNTAGAYSKAKEKGVLSTLPELSGVILYMAGHVGVYMGNGRFVECVGSGVGMREGRILNGKIISGSKFTHWFKDINIQYQQEDTKLIDELKTIIASLQSKLTKANSQIADLKNQLTEATEITSMKISGGDGSISTISSIVRNDYNYCKFRDMVDELNRRLGLGITIVYDEETKVITVENKMSTMKISGGNIPINEIPSILYNDYNYVNLRSLINEINQRLELGIVVSYNDDTKIINILEDLI